MTTTFPPHWEQVNIFRHKNTNRFLRQSKIGQKQENRRVFRHEDLKESRYNQAKAG